MTAANESAVPSSPAISDAPMTIGHTSALQERHFRYLVKCVTEYAIYMMDLEGIVSSWNIGAERAKLYRAEEIIGRHFSCFYTEEDRAAGLPKSALRLARETGRFEAEGWRLRKDGSRFWASVVIDPVYDDDGALIGFAKVTRDLTQKKADAEHIATLATQDHLTKVVNRRVFQDSLERRLREFPSGRLLSVFLIDIDHFKSINDRYGHLTGDAVLAGVAQRLASLLRGDDVIARIGGDEFGILLGAATTMRPETIAERIVGALHAPFIIDQDVSIAATLSVGFTTTMTDGDCKTDTLLNQADIALYKAKADGRCCYRSYSPALEREITERRELAADLRHSVETGAGLSVHYQPIVDLATGRIVTREALARWHCAGRGAVPPSRFIPLAEELGLIRQLGLWVLAQSCAAAKGWDDDVRVAVNVSALQLVAGFAERVLGVLTTLALPANRLDIEITETVLMHSSAEAVENLHRLKAAGVTITLDDFGVGFSSFACVRAFSFDRIKIDGSFVRDAVARRDCQVIVGVIGELGRRLGITIVAEGVETPEQLELVRDQGCHEVQGYLLGKPAPLAHGHIGAAVANIL
jgi:diguanylate cyclase (GGDEF)-like protein/PAS domain S-box-containing protein